MYELKPIHSKQKSFYGKAMVAVDTGAGTHYILRSYGTPVQMQSDAKINRKRG